MLVFPKLFTERLTLRKLEPEDLPRLVRYANNRKIADYIANIPHPYREPDAAFRIGYVLKGFKEKSRFVFAIALRESGEFIGEISLHLTDPARKHAQLAYWLGEPYWNQGYATEAIGAILTFGFDQADYALIYGDCRPENQASTRVMQKNRMQAYPNRGNLLLFAIKKEDERRLDF
ncbi:MAG: GNAT family N-acetyltransferase [Bacteroidota bacterium]